MKFSLLKFRTVVMLFSLLFISGLFVASFQNNISKANSFIASIIVNLPHLDFGLVFPGEQPQKTFIVSYSDVGDGDGSYTITEKYKPLDPIDSDYCQTNYEDYTRCYKTLCPYIEEFSEEDEGDTVFDASVSLNDPEDIWVVAFNKNFVPAVIGNVSQDHKGDIISESGIYGCDLSFNVDVESYCGDGNLDPGEECDNGINNSDEPGSTCSTQCMKRGVCENADVIIDLDPVLWVVGENCHSSDRIQDSVNINIPRTAQGEVYGQSNRGNIGQEQINESFHLEINGTDGPVSLDDLDPVAVTTRFENLGNFPFTVGSQTVYMNTNAQCPPDIHANSVELDKLCIYLDPYQGPRCGDGNLDPGEQCDDGNNVNGDGCSAVCNKEGNGGGGGGGSVLVSLQINNAGECVVTEDGTYFSWKTNMTSSSRVVCDKEPNPNWGTPPDYGYFLYTDELNLSPRVLNHEVEIPGLVPGENYYCRVISSNSSTTVFEEVICSVPEEEEEGEVKGIEDVIIPEALPKTGYGA